MRAKHHIILPTVEGRTSPIVHKEVNIATDKASHKQHANAHRKSILRAVDAVQSKSTPHHTTLHCLFTQLFLLVLGIQDLLYRNTAEFCSN